MPRPTAVARACAVLCLALAGCLTRPAVASGQVSAPRIALFRADGFPTVDAPVIPHTVLNEALENLPVDTLTSAVALGAALRRPRIELLVLPYGSAFPLDAWDAIRAFVRSGGSLVVLGGAPFHQPVRWQAEAGPAAGQGRWIAGPRQPSFAREFLIGPAEAILVPPQAEGPLASPVPRSEWTTTLARPTTAFALTVRFATVPDMPGEEGSAGPRDAVLRPLAHVMGADGLAVACPLVEIDRLRGEEAGARWVFAPSDAVLSPASIRAAILRAREGAVEMEARPIRASIEPGETPSIRVSVRRPVPRSGDVTPSVAHLVVRDDRGRQVSALDVPLAGPPESVTGVRACE